MFGQRRSIALTAVTVVVAILLSGALAIAAAPECALLNDSEVMALISSAGETALMIICDEIAPAEIPSTPPKSTEVPSAPGVEMLVNDRTVDLSLSLFPTGRGGGRDPGERQDGRCW
jgi:hypothetical protein